MRVNRLIWIGVLVWILGYALVFLAASILLFQRRQVFMLVFTAAQVTLVSILVTVYACWLIINIASAIQTWRTSRLNMVVIFLIQIYISLAVEMYLLHAIFNHRDELIWNFLDHAVTQLVGKYVDSKDAADILDWIHETFECCGITQWHYEWWLDDNGWILPRVNHTYAWVPQSCCIRTAYYKNCGVARPRRKPRSTSDNSSGGEESEEEKKEDEVDDGVFETGSYAATDWYTRLNNEPCPDMIVEYVGEWPTYILMALISFTVGKATMSTAASFGIISKANK
ncbi:unnamed protein product [Mesocestoides corti]|uniref:Tetraspanin n=1 Tax=Mesocestoides corti TaxID=53468 RepID=A0A0R3UNL9_MESCO|nr:unnamed protein product [Mesocestoides corti]